MSKPKLTPTQRGHYLAIARLLDRVSPRKFNMSNWVIKVSEAKEMLFPHYHRFNRPNECGYAGCAIGWAATLPRFRHAGSKAPDRHDEIVRRLGAGSIIEPGSVAQLLFGPNRKVTPRQVAADIRTYLKSGALPAEQPSSRLF